jgi:hypothetical protein
LSTTVTVNVQLGSGAVPGDPHVASGWIPFEAVQVTGVIPFGNVEADAGLQTTVGAGKPVTVGVNVAVAVHRPGSVFFVISAGQVIAAGSLI